MNLYTTKTDANYKGKATRISQTHNEEKDRENLVTTGKVEGERAIGKRRVTFVKSVLCDMKDISSAVELLQSTDDTGRRAGPFMSPTQ